MKIEHFALQVPDPAAAADWYVKHLGFRVKRAVESPFSARYVADSADAVMLELYCNPAFPVPDYRSMDPTLLHIAMLCDDLEATIETLRKAGAVLASGPIILGDDRLATLRDPWGVAIQFVVRKERFV
jgi:catechol 2,3-dioxygenase-like lactoylglutathione lyase family enzyme